jgi:hypothetical protein
MENWNNGIMDGRVIFWLGHYPNIPTVHSSTIPVG